MSLVLNRGNQEQLPLFGSQVYKVVGTVFGLGGGGAIFFFIYHTYI